MIAQQPEWPGNIFQFPKIHLLRLFTVLLSGLLISGILLAVFTPALPGDKILDAKDELAGRIGGASLAIAVRDQYAFMGYSFEFAVLDISNPQKPVRISFLPLPSNDIVLRGDLAYVVGRQGLSVVDIANPERPVQIGLLATSDPFMDIALGAGYAYIAGTYADFLVVDITAPDHPVQAGLFAVPGQVQDVAAIDNYVYLAASGCLLVLDVTDPHLPAQVGVLPLAHGAQAIVLRGNSAYVSLLGGLAVVDISHPEKPVLIGQLDMPGYFDELAVSGNLAYLTNGPSGLRIADLSDPTDPVSVEVVSLPGLLVDVALAHERLYLINTSGCLYILGLDDPTHLLGSFLSPGPVIDVVVVGRTAFVTAGWEDELHILSLSNNRLPQDLAAYPTLGLLGWTVAEDGEHVYAAGALAGPYSIKVPGSGQPAVLEPAWIAVNQPLQQDRKAYATIPDPLGGLHILDVSDPDRPDQVGYYRPPGTMLDMAVSQMFVYIATDRSCLTVLDVSEPGSPTAIRTVHGLGKITAMTAVSDHLFVAVQSRSLHIFDLSDPADPVLVSSTSLPGQVLDIAVAGERAFLASGTMGVMILNIADPSLPARLYSIQTYSAQGVAAYDEGIFVADSLAGLLIYSPSGNSRRSWWPGQTPNQ